MPSFSWGRAAAGRATGNRRDVGGPVSAKIPVWNADQSPLQMTNTSTVGVLLLDGEDHHVRAYPSGIPSARDDERGDVVAVVLSLHRDRAHESTQRMVHVRHRGPKQSYHLVASEALSGVRVG